MAEQGAQSSSESPLQDDEDLKRLFDSLDVSRDGQLEVQEVQAALQRLGLPASAAYMSDLLSQYDKDRSGCIDFEEFRRYAVSKERSIRAVFAAIDADGDGRLDVGEVRDAATALGLSVDAREAEHMIELLDADGDGRIDFAEFRRFCVLLPGSQVSRTNILAAWIDSTSWLDSMEYRLGHVPPSQGLERLMAGGVAGAVSRTAVAPLERLRTIMMADRSASHLGPVLRRMWADGGPRGLFRGNLATVIKVFPSSAIQFAVYDACKDVMLHFAGRGATDISPQQKFGAGLVAGATACGATYPLEALRTQISVAQGGGASASYSAVVRSLVAERGLRGLYQGFSAGLANNSFTMALGFATYEGLCTAYTGWQGHTPTPGTKGVLGGAAALAVTAATMPLENVVRRLQVQGRPGFPRQYSGALDCTSQMLRQEGVAAFWRGSLSSFAKVVPSIAATRLLYESIVQLRGIGGVRRYRIGAESSS